MSSSAPRPPVWLLDVDGVVNATRPGWGAAPRRASVYADGDAWTMRWAPALTDRIRDLHLAGVAEVRWCTTWCPWADQLERLWRLPVLAKAFTDPLTGPAAAAAKLAAARTVRASGRRLVWTDDEVTPRSGPVHDELTADASGLLIAPTARRGLQPADIDAITAFCITSAPA